jgi:hypothetical protein
MSTSLFAPDFLAIFNSNRDTGGPLKAFASPADWRDQWIYFLMVDRFNNSQNAPNHAPFDDPNFFAFQGGNLASVQDQLPYIKQLGAGAIWLSPVLSNVLNQPGTYHGYGIRDFLHVDPRFARDPANADDELRSLVDAAHSLGLYVILDIVLNHTGDTFAYAIPAKPTASIRMARKLIFGLRRVPFNGATTRVMRAPTGRTSRLFPIHPPTRSSGRSNCTTIVICGVRGHLDQTMIPSAISARSSSSEPICQTSSSSLFAAISM